MSVKPFWFPPATTTQPQPVELPWPAWALAVKALASPEDKGVGDTIARIVGPIGGNSYKLWFKATFGKPCGCTERQSAFNHRFPY